MARPFSWCGVSTHVHARNVSGCSSAQRPSIRATHRGRQSAASSKPLLPVRFVRPSSATLGGNAHRAQTYSRTRLGRRPSSIGDRPRRRDGSAFFAVRKCNATRIGTSTAVAAPAANNDSDQQHRQRPIAVPRRAGMRRPTCCFRRGTRMICALSAESCLAGIPAALATAYLCNDQLVVGYVGRLAEEPDQRR
jgi:hypothetical protein